MSHPAVLIVLAAQSPPGASLCSLDADKRPCCRERKQTKDEQFQSKGTKKPPPHPSLLSFRSNLLVVSTLSIWPLSLWKTTHTRLPTYNLPIQQRLWRSYQMHNSNKAMTFREGVPIQHFPCVWSTTPHPPPVVWGNMMNWHPHHTTGVAMWRRNWIGISLYVEQRFLLYFFALFARIFFPAIENVENSQRSMPHLALCTRKLVFTRGRAHVPFVYFLMLWTKCWWLETLCFCSVNVRVKKKKRSMSCQAKIQPAATPNHLTSSREKVSCTITASLISKNWVVQLDAKVKVNDF